MSQQQVYKYITLNNLKAFLNQLQSLYKATKDSFGGIKIGFPESLTPDDNEQIQIPVKLSNKGQAFVSVPYREYELKVATADELGGVKISNSESNALEIQKDGSLSLNIDDKTLSHKADKIQLGKDINWIADESINNYNSQGIYNLSGKSTGRDGLPIPGGCKFNARLSVFETKTTDETHTCVTQLLVISSEDVAGDVYIRTNSFNDENVGVFWRNVKWSKLQPSHMLGKDNPDNCIENGFHVGFYNGYTKDTENKPFTILVVDGLNAETKCQFKFSTDNDGNPKLQQRKMTYASQKWNFGDWEDVVKQQEQEIPNATAYHSGIVKIGKGIETSTDEDNSTIINISHSGTNTLYQIKNISVENTTTVVDLDPRKYNILEHKGGKGFENVTINQISTTTMLNGDYVQTGSDKDLYSRMTEFGFQFLASDKGCTLKYDFPIKWANGIKPIIKPNDLIEIRFTYIPDKNILASWTKYV